MPYAPSPPKKKTQYWCCQNNLLKQHTLVSFPMNDTRSKHSSSHLARWTVTPDSNSLTPVSRKIRIRLATLHTAAHKPTRTRTRHLRHAFISPSELGWKRRGVRSHGTSSLLNKIMLTHANLSLPTLDIACKFGFFLFQPIILQADHRQLHPQCQPVRRLPRCCNIRIIFSSSLPKHKQRDRLTLWLHAHWGGGLMPYVLNNVNFDVKKID